MKLIQKDELKNGYYYAGYINQHYCVLTSDQQKIVGMWDSQNECFWFWEDDGNRRTKSKLAYLPDIDNEIENGFFPVKEVIPKQEFIFD